MMGKLKQRQVWLEPELRPKMCQTAIIIEWDDILYCTTFLNQTYGDLQGAALCHIHKLQ